MIEPITQPIILEVEEADGEYELDVQAGSCEYELGFCTNVYVDKGARDYERLNNKPQINSVTLIGNKISSQLGLADAFELATTEEINNLF